MTEAASAPAIDTQRLIEDLRALVQIPSITGSEERVMAWAADALRDLGMRVEVVRPDPAAIRADPAWPGEEMPRTSLPVVIGRAGATDAPAHHPVGSPRRRAAGRSGDVDGRPVGRARSATGGCTAVVRAT